MFSNPLENTYQPALRLLERTRPTATGKRTRSRTGLISISKCELVARILDLPHARNYWQKIQVELAVEAATDEGFSQGLTLEGAYYMRWLDNFRGAGTEGIGRIFNQGYQVQASAMVVPKTLQVYAGHSKIFGQQGNPWDFRVGVNSFPL